MNKYRSTLNEFLLVFHFKKHTHIYILTVDNQVLYYCEGNELTSSKTSYHDPTKKCIVDIDNDSLLKSVMWWKSDCGNIFIYI